MIWCNLTNFYLLYNAIADEKHTSTVQLPPVKAGESSNYPVRLRVFFLKEKDKFMSRKSGPVYHYELD